MKKIELSTNEFPTVTSLANLEVGKIYKTVMYAVLIPLLYNRGVANGIINRKVLAIKQMIESGLFFMNVVHVEINLKGQIIDGHHRYMALKQMGLPINFIINMQPEFNCDDPSEILNNVSEYNEINSSWTDKDAYLSALGFNEAAAMAIFSLKKYVATKDIDSKIFTPARVIALATKGNGLAGKKQKRAVYCSQEIAATINTADFYNEIDQIIELLQYVNGLNFGIAPWFFVRAMKPIDWKGERSFQNIFNLLKKDGLKSYSEKKKNAGNIENYINQLIFNDTIKKMSKRK